MAEATEEMKNVEFSCVSYCVGCRIRATARWSQPQSTTICIHWLRIILTNLVINPNNEYMNEELTFSLF